MLRLSGWKTTSEVLPQRPSPGSTGSRWRAFLKAEAAAQRASAEAASSGDESVWLHLGPARTLANTEVRRQLKSHHASLGRWATAASSTVFPLPWPVTNSYQFLLHCFFQPTSSPQKNTHHGFSMGAHKGYNIREGEDYSVWLVVMYIGTLYIGTNTDICVTAGIAQQETLTQDGSAL